MVRTLATICADEQDQQELKVALITALLRLSIGEDSKLRKQIVDAGALPALVKVMATRLGVFADDLQHCAAGCLGCIARGDDASREAVLESGAIAALCQSLDFNSEVVVQQECCTALANVMWNNVDAVATVRDLGGVAKFLERIEYKNVEVMNEEKWFALQDAACGALVNMCIADEGEGERSVSDLIGRDGKDKLSKFVHGASNEPAARKAVQLLEKCGIKGVGTRGLFIDKVKSVVMGIIIWRMCQVRSILFTTVNVEKLMNSC